MTAPINGTPGTDPAADPNADPATDPATETVETAEEKAARLEEENAALKQHSRKHEQRAKDNKAAADELARIKAENATPDQKLTLAEERAVKAETELARYKVAHETSLPSALLSLLNGDEDQMREQAKALIAFKGEAAPIKPKPIPDPSQGGSREGTKPSKADEGREEAQRRIAARKKS